MIGVEEIGGAVQFVPVAEFAYPDDGDRDTPCVRDQRTDAPLVKKCQQRFALVPGGDVMTMPRHRAAGPMRARRGAAPSAGSRRRGGS